MDIEPLEMDRDELVWLAITGLPFERELAVEELRRRQMAEPEREDRAPMN